MCPQPFPPTRHHPSNRTLPARASSAPQPPTRRLRTSALTACGLAPTPCAPRTTRFRREKRSPSKQTKERPRANTRNHTRPRETSSQAAHAPARAHPRLARDPQRARSTHARRTHADVTQPPRNTPSRRSTRPTARPDGLTPQRPRTTCFAFREKELLLRVSPASSFGLPSRRATRTSYAKRVRDSISSRRVSARFARLTARRLLPHRGPSGPPRLASVPSGFAYAQPPGAEASPGRPCGPAKDRGATVRLARLRKTASYVAQVGCAT